MINNLGGLSVLELNVIAGEVVDQLLTTSLEIRRMLVGTFVTSLDGPGFSVTMLTLQPGIEELLNSGTTAPAWSKHVEPTGHVNGVVERVVTTRLEGLGKSVGRILIPGMCSSYQLQSQISPNL